jgi:hypothetical protein
VSDCAGLKSFLRACFLFLAVSIVTAGCDKNKMSENQNVFVLKGTFACKMQPPSPDLDKTIFFTILYNCNVFSIKTYDSASNILTQESFDGDDLGRWSRPDSNIIATAKAWVDNAYIWNGNGAIPEQALSYSEWLLISSLAAACPDIRNCVLKRYESAYTNYVDCQPMVSKTNFTGATSQNGLHIEGGACISDTKLTSGFLGSREYFAKWVDNYGGILTNSYCRILYADYTDCDGEWIPMSIRVQDTALPSVMDLSYFIELEKPYKKEILKRNIYPDISFSLTGFYDKRIGSRHYYIKNGIWPSSISALHNTTKRRKGIVIAFLIIISITPLLVILMSKIKQNNITKNEN